jgi:hypothetical protein
MATFTTRLGLRKPDPTPGGDTWSTATDLNANWDKIDAAMPPIVCTSSTRPSTGLFLGMTIFETDTLALLVLDQISPARWRNPKTNITNIISSFAEVTHPVFNQIVHNQPDGMLYRYNGSAFKTFLPGGFMFAPVKRNNTDAVTGDVILETGTNAASKPYLTTNWYRAVWGFNHSSSVVGPPNGTARIRLSALNGAVSTGSTAIAEGNVLNQTATNPRVHLETIFDVPSEGVYTLGCSATSGGAPTLTIQPSQGSGNTGRARIFYVQDMGPK